MKTSKSHEDVRILTDCEGKTKKKEKEKKKKETKTKKRQKFKKGRPSKEIHGTYI